MTLFKGLYTNAQDMNAEKVLNTNNFANTLSEKQEALKEAWRKDSKALFSESTQQEDEEAVNYRKKYC